MNDLGLPAQQAQVIRNKQKRFVVRTPDGLSAFRGWLPPFVQNFFVPREAPSMTKASKKITSFNLDSSCFVEK